MNWALEAGNLVSKKKARRSQDGPAHVKGKLQVDPGRGKMGAERPNPRPKMAQVGPKVGQEGGKMGTKMGQEGAREAQGGPKMAQDGPKAAPRGGGKGKGPRWAPRGARRAQERPKVAPGAARKTGTQN